MKKIYVPNILDPKVSAKVIERESIAKLRKEKVKVDPLFKCMAIAYEKYVKTSMKAESFKLS